MRRVFAILLLFSFGSMLFGDPAPKRQATAAQILIRAGRLIDTRHGRVLENQAILIEGDRIKQVGPFDEVRGTAPASARLIDLSKETVLPGLSDCHTHVLLQGDVTAADTTSSY
jgi:imidazolonepropionase-like amidohydrolase